MQPHDTTSSDVPLKRCSKCQEWKFATTNYFARNKASKDGIRPNCKKCDEKYRAANRDRHNAYNLIYNEANKERLVEYRRQYRAARKELIAIANREWRAANKSYVLQKNRQYRANNKERALQYTRVAKIRRRERERNAEGHHTRTDIKRQYKAQKGKCYYCGCDLNGKYQTDHVIPLSRGGSNGPENIVVACPPCNGSKGTKMPHEWVGSNRLL